MSCIDKQRQPLTPEVSGRAGPARSRQRRLFLIAAGLLGLAMLACALGGPASRPGAGAVVIRNHLPTLTPTPRPAGLALMEPAPAQAAVLEAAAIEPVPVKEFAAVTEAAAVEPGSVTAGPASSLLAPEPALAPLNPAPAAADASPPGAPPVAPAAGSPLELPAAPSPAPSSPGPDLPGSPGWSFANVQLSPDPANGRLLMYGNLVNNSGASQEIRAIDGTFYDVQGQVIAATTSDDAYWPAYVAPGAGSVPFYVVVDDITQAADYNLRITAGPTGQAPRQDFQFVEVNQSNEAGAYCVTGQLRNQGGSLHAYLVIAAVLYDAQDKVIAFGDQAEFGPTGVVGDQALPFEICIDRPGQSVARYQLSAWGL